MIKTVDASLSFAQRGAHHVARVFSLKLQVVNVQIFLYAIMQQVLNVRCQIGLERLTRNYTQLKLFLLHILPGGLNIFLRKMEDMTMTTVEKIQDEILSLPDSEKSRLFRWFADYEAKVWDHEIESDFTQGGRGQEFLDRVKSDYKAGKCSR